MKKLRLSAAIAAALALLALPASAQTNEITIGISISTTGPAAALGIPERNALEFVPKEIGGRAGGDRCEIHAGLTSAGAWPKEGTELSPIVD